MKVTSLISLSLVSLVLAFAPLVAEAKAQGERQKSEQRQVTVNSNKAPKAAGSSKPKKHVVHPRIRGDKKRHYRSDKRRHYRQDHRLKYRRHRIADVIIGGAILHGIFGHHGSHYRGHPWCPMHSIYHTHRYYDYDHSIYWDFPRKVESYIDLDEGMCYRVTEYSNGDQRRKRIRDHYCAELDEGVNISINKDENKDKDEDEDEWENWDK